MKTAFLTVVYPGCKLFLADFLRSFAAQTDRECDLLLVDDGVGGEYLVSMSQQFSLSTIRLPGSTSPARNRAIGINYALEQGYDVLILGDADDTFARNRVEVCKRVLAGQPCVFMVNDIAVPTQADMLGPAKKYLSMRLPDGLQISGQHLLHSNFCGFSNSALRLDTFEPVSFPDDIFAVDWYLFSTIVAGGACGVFSTETWTVYRQHDANLLGSGGPSPEDVPEMLARKADHYRHMQHVSVVFADLFREYSQLLRRFNTESGFRRAYLDRVFARCPKWPFWWEAITL